MHMDYEAFDRAAANLGGQIRVLGCWHVHPTQSRPSGIDLENFIREVAKTEGDVRPLQEHDRHPGVRLAQVVLDHGAGEGSSIMT